MAKFSVLTINIERKKHLNRLIPFLTKERPDIICLQEIYQDDFLEIKGKLGFNGAYANRVEYYGVPGFEGMAVLTKFKINSYQLIPYDQFTHLIPEFVGRLVNRPATALMALELEINNQNYMLGNTHFTWSAGGEVTNEQRTNMQALLKIVEQFPDLILCGDFNTPRGKELYDALAARLQDNVPQHITSTIDGQYHRAGQLELVVDGLFTSPQYQVEETKVVCGLSDHCGILATLHVDS